MSKVCGYCLCVDGHMGPCPHQEIERLRAENSRIRAALKPILARIEMPAGGFSRTQDVMIQASELVVLQAALAGEEKNG